MNIFLFAVLTVVNIILQTTHTVCIVKCKKWVASIVSAVAFGVYTVVVVFTAKALIDNFVVDTVIKCAIVAAANLFGTFFSLWVMEKLKKDKLWEITVIVKSSSDLKLIGTSLDLINVGYTIIETSGTTQYYVMTIYSYTQRQSLGIKEVLRQFPVRYIVHEEAVTL